MASRDAPGSLGADDSAALDGLRGLAALIVVASHASGMGQHWLPGLPLTGIGKTGVYLFFVLSAFLLTLQWLQALEAARRDVAGDAAGPPFGRYLGRYLVRRVLRIYPLYACVLLAGWALAPRGLGVPLDGAAVLRHLTLQEGRDLYWSVPVEFLYYLVIPPLALWLAALRVPPALRAAAVVLLGAAALAVWPPGLAPVNSIVLAYYLPIFLAGSLAAWAWHRGAVPRAPRAGRASVADAVVLVLLLSSVPAVFTALGWAADVDALHRAFTGWGLFWSAMLLGVLGGWLPLWRHVLRWRGLRACGRWCFGLYLLHIPALALANKLPLPGVARAAAGLAGALLLAALAWRVVERPALRWAERIAGGGRPVA